MLYDMQPQCTPEHVFCRWRLRYRRSP
jgi:hypothetical protein